MAAVKIAVMDLVMVVVMGEGSLVVLEEAEAMELVNRVWESRIVAMTKVAAMTVEEVENLVVVVEAIWEVMEAPMIIILQHSVFKLWANGGRKPIKELRSL